MTINFKYHELLYRSIIFGFNLSYTLYTVHYSDALYNILNNLWTDLIFTLQSKIYKRVDSWEFRFTGQDSLHVRFIATKIKFTGILATVTFSQNQKTFINKLPDIARVGQGSVHRRAGLSTVGQGSVHYKKWRRLLGHTVNYCLIYLWISWG